MRRSVKDDVCTGACEDELEIVPVLQLPDDRNDRRLLPDPLLLEDAQLPLDLVDAVLPVAEEIEPFGAALEELPTELGPDAPAGSYTSTRLPRT